MPLTDTLTSARKLEESGVPPQQARVLSELFEQTARAAQPDLGELVTKDFLRGELGALELRVEKVLRQQMLWFFAMQIAIAAATLTLAKFLF